MEKIRKIGKLAIWRTGQSVKWLFIGLVLGELACFPRWWIKQRIQTLYTQNKLYFYYNSITPFQVWAFSSTYKESKVCFIFLLVVPLEMALIMSVLPHYTQCPHRSLLTLVLNPLKVPRPKNSSIRFFSSLRATEMLCGADSTSLLRQLQLQGRM